jgi:hypothetical protein
MVKEASPSMPSAPWTPPALDQLPSPAALARLAKRWSGLMAIRAKLAPGEAAICLPFAIAHSPATC